MKLGIFDTKKTFLPSTVNPSSQNYYKNRRGVNTSMQSEKYKSQMNKSMKTQQNSSRTSEKNFGDFGDLHNPKITQRSILYNKKNNKI